MERVVTWALREAVEDVDDSVAMAALLGAGLDSATFAAAGVPAGAAVAAGAVTGAGLKVYKKVRGGGKR